MIGINLVIACIVFSLLYCIQLYYKNFILKLILITYLFFVSSAIYFSFATYKGWPADDTVNKGTIVYGMVEEPTEISKGAIYLWVVPKREELNWFQKIYTYYENTKAPRAYRLPYKDKLAGAVNRAIQQINEGMIVEIDGLEGLPPDGPEGKNDKGQDGVNSGDAEDYKVPHLVIMSPDRKLIK
jgi:hypothetical protein